MKKATALISLLVLLITFAGCSPGKNLTPAEQRDAINDMEAQTLQKLYAEKPSARDEVEKATGYAAFSNANVNIILASMGGGYGVAVNNATGERTYMKMGTGGIGLGLGVKDYRQVLIFFTEEAYKNFIYSGWKFGGHADAAAKAGDKGAEASAEGMFGSTKVYAMTESGLALQATVAGAKYYTVDELNN
jgi:lipid-binding SYLF domain-containing protein